MKKRGFTIIEMVVVVLILIIISIAAVWGSKPVNTKAELANVESELKAVRTGVIRINSDYNNGIIDEYTSGEHYNTTIVEDDGKAWYVIYGIGNSNCNEDILDNLGVSDLKRDYKVNYETLDVEFLNGPVTVGEYKINSYEDMQTLIESGVI